MLLPIGISPMSPPIVVGGNTFLTSLWDAFEFDEASGTPVNKVSSGRNGTNSGATQSASGGVIGGHIDFDVDGDYVDYGSESTHKFLHYGTDGTDMLWTMEFWLKFPTTPGDMDTQNTIFGNNGGTKNQDGIQIKYDDRSGSGHSRAINLLISSNSGSVAVISGDIENIYPNDTNWNQIILTYDQSLSSANLKGYTNGILVGTGDKAIDTPDNENSFYVPRLGLRGSDIIPLLAKMDMFRIWKTRIMTPTEITSLYNGGDGIAYSEFE